MCGIAGVMTPDPREAEAVLGRMVPTMIHRGPDDAGHEILSFRAAGGPAFVGLGFRRLAILDLSPTGHQPMRNPESGDVLVFNGEIYNFGELRTELERAGCRFRGKSDSEVLLHALGLWGESALARLEGMYAFAFHRASDQALLLARDPLGIKPLYVSRRPGRMVFASEIRTVLASGIVPCTIDVAGITSMLAFGSVQSPHTPFTAIEEFPPGHAEWVGASRHCFWRCPAVDAVAGGDAVDATRWRVRDAVRRHLVADVPVGVFLSAGIDSTIVAACAAEVTSAITSFTVGIGPRHPDDETAVAAETARRLGVRHEVVAIDDRELPLLWHDWIGSLDCPSIDGFNTYLVTKGLADRGIKVGLSGLGADELFGGYPVFRQGPRIRRLMAALSFLPASAVAAAAERCLAAAGRRGAGEKLADVLRGGRDIGSIALGLRRVLPDRQLRSLGVDAAAIHAPGMATSPAPDLPPGDDFNAISRVELTHYMRATLLRDSDANSMSQSLELRVPFLDQALVSYALTLPGVVKAGAEGSGKHLLRAAFADRIPGVVAQRRKTGFTLPIGEWMLGGMRQFCNDAVDALARLPCLDGTAVSQTWTRYLAAPETMSWSRPFSLVVLGAYLQRHAAAADDP